MAERLEGAPQGLEISLPVSRLNQEVKRRAVMPDIDGPRLPVAGHVRLNPADSVCPVAETRLRAIDRGRGDIEHRQAGEAALERRRRHRHA